MKLKVVFLLSVLLFAASSARARIIPVNFENMPVTSGGTGFFGEQSIDQLLIKLTRPFSFYDFKELAGVPTSWGARTLSPFASTDGSVFIISFSAPVDGISIDMGDGGGDTDDLTIFAYAGPNASGAILGVVTTTLPGNGSMFSYKTVTASFAGARSFSFSGGSNNDNSTYYDNIKIILRPNAADFDGDYQNDFSVFRPSSGVWYAIPSFGFQPIVQQQFGSNGDKVANGDFDGDGRADMTVFRNGIWYSLMTLPAGFRAVQFGAAGDRPVVADYDGDGKSDIAVFRPSDGNWYIINSSDNQFRGVNFGLAGDIPVPCYFDADGKADIAVFRPSNGTWYYLGSATGAFTGRQWGQNGDLPVVADFDADGRSDTAVFRPSNGTWYILNSSNNSLRATQWGLNGDIPVPGSYDDTPNKANPFDPRANIAVFRPSTGYWYLQNRETGALVAQPWGASGDVPIAAAYLVQ